MNHKKKEGTRLYRLTRIQQIEQSEEPYFIDKSFSPEHYFKYSLGVFHNHYQKPIEVKLRFKSFLIPLICETKIHPSMKIISQTEDELIIMIEVYNTIELKNLILSYGADVEVMSPTELREEIKDSLKKMLLVYE